MGSANSHYPKLHYPGVAIHHIISQLQKRKNDKRHSGCFFLHSNFMNIWTMPKAPSDSSHSLWEANFPVWDLEIQKAGQSTLASNTAGGARPNTAYFCEHSQTGVETPQNATQNNTNTPVRDTSSAPSCWTTTADTHSSGPTETGWFLDTAGCPIFQSSYSPVFCFVSILSILSLSFWRQPAFLAKRTFQRVALTHTQKKTKKTMNRTSLSWPVSTEHTFTDNT